MPDGLRADLFGKFTTRNNAQTALTNAQRNFDKSGADNYKVFREAIAIVVGAMGKLTPEGKQVLKMRKNVTKPGQGGGGSSKSSSGSSSSSSSSSGSDSSSSSSSS